MTTKAATPPAFYETLSRPTQLIAQGRSALALSRSDCGQAINAFARTASYDAGMGRLPWQAPRWRKGSTRVKTFVVALSMVVCVSASIRCAAASDVSERGEDHFRRHPNKSSHLKSASAATGLPLQPVTQSAGPRKGGKPIEEPEKTERTETPSAAAK